MCFIDSLTIQKSLLPTGIFIISEKIFGFFVVESNILYSEIL